MGKHQNERRCKNRRSQSRLSVKAPRKHGVVVDMADLDNGLHELNLSEGMATPMDGASSGGGTTSRRRDIDMGGLVLRGSFPGAAPGVAETATLEAEFVKCGVVILDAKENESWQMLHDSNSRVVAVDTDGTHFEPPLLVAVAFYDAEDGKFKVLLEAPHGSLSEKMRALLRDTKITKAYCDSGSTGSVLGLLGGDERVQNTADVQRMAPPPEIGIGLAPQTSLCALFSRVFANKQVVKNRHGWKFFAGVKARQPFDWPFAAPEDRPLRAYAASKPWATLLVYAACSGREEKGDRQIEALSIVAAAKRNDSDAAATTTTTRSPRPDDESDDDAVVEDAWPPDAAAKRRVLRVFRRRDPTGNPASMMPGRARRVSRFYY